MLGFNTQSEVFYEAEFRGAGLRGCIVATADGSYGVKGFATTPLNELNYAYCLHLRPGADVQGRV